MPSTMNFAVFFLCVIAQSVAFVGQQNVKPIDGCRVVTAKDLIDAGSPTFDSYPVPKEPGYPTPKLDVKSNPIARRYPSVLRQAMSEGPNYAGHFHLATWGCGSSCAMFAVINLKTGAVLTARQISSVAQTLYLDTDGFLPGANRDSWGFRFKADSSLLVVVGDPDEDSSRTGAYYFVVRDESLQLIHATLVRKTCPSDQR